MFKFLLYFLAFSILLFSNDIKDYRAVSGCYDINGTKYSALRAFKEANASKVLVVNTQTLHTTILKEQNWQKAECNSSKYSDILNISTSDPYPLTNDGIIATKNGIVVTTDLCPSSKSGFEERLYTALINNFKNPTAVTLFITKRWITKHTKEFEQFKNWQNEGKLDITWGNHTAYHHYHPKVPLEHNFVLSPDENLTKDILDLEIELINRGVTPSVFFRFPGLVSDKKSVEIVKSMGLIIVGANTWLAKGEKLKPNSIILLHGNKNEPKGVDIFLNLIKEGKIEELKDIKSSF